MVISEKQLKKLIKEAQEKSVRETIDRIDKELVWDNNLNDVVTKRNWKELKKKLLSSLPSEAFAKDGLNPEGEEK